MAQKLVYRREKSYPLRKTSKIQELTEILRKYSNILLLSIRDVNANQMKMLRKKLWGKGLVKVVKNSLLELAIDKIKHEKPMLDKLKDLLTDMHALVFTNDDIFEVARIINSIKEKRALKPGKISPVDVVLKKGFTGFKPGPEMSEMRMAGVPVRIFDGEVFIQQDHILVKKGQVVSPYAARVMALLDIKPLEIGPEVIIGISDRYMISKETLLKPLESYLEELQYAISEATILSLQALIPMPDTIGDILTLPARETFLLGIEIALVTTDTLPHLLKRTFSETLGLLTSIADKLPEIPEDLKSLVATQPAEEKAPSKEGAPKEEKPEEKEEEGLAGLSLLF